MEAADRDVAGIERFGEAVEHSVVRLGAWNDDSLIATEVRQVDDHERPAARAAATYMSHLIGEAVGDTVGYRTRGDSRTSDRTRIEVVTERLLTRRLQRDPELTDIGLVIFDEVHERSLDTDLGMALCLDVARSLRPDLRILAMSATPDIEAIATVLQDPATTSSVPASTVPVIISSGVAHPIDTIYLGTDRHKRLADEVAAAIATARRDVGETGGDILVFLPGRREIRHVGERLAASGIDFVPLVAGLDQPSLDRALRPDPLGRQKVILATSVAQTSLTIDGVRVVVDAGLERDHRFDPSRGMGGLVTIPASVATADQRRGRAGRQAPGRCYRLWNETDNNGRRAQSEPAIVGSDLAQFALDLAAWGVTDPAAMAWITPPPAAAWDTATATLTELGAIDHSGRITADGRRIADLGAHPRLGRLMLDADSQRFGQVGTLVAASIEAGVRGDICRAIDRPERDVAQNAKRWASTLTHTRTDDGYDDHTIGALVATAFPERVARRRGTDRHRFLMANGIGATLRNDSPLAGSEWLAIAEVERSTTADGVIVSAAPLGGQSLTELLDARQVQHFATTVSDDAVVSGRTTLNVGAIVVRDQPAKASDLDVATLLDAAAQAIAARGVGILDWNESARRLQARAVFASSFTNDIPDVSDESLAQLAPTWLPAVAPLAKTTNAIRLGTLHASDVLASVIPWDARRQIDALAPSDIEIPSGRRATVLYEPDGPILRVKLQEMFGATSSPTVARVTVPITLHLLSPAGRPLQVTQDLESFWSGSYAAVRSEMRGRYPKHPWPEDPMNAIPTSRATPRPR